MLYVSIIIFFNKYTPISLSPSPVEHLGCSKFFAIRNRAAINILVQVFVDSIFPYLLGKDTVELLGHRVGAYLVL